MKNNNLIFEEIRRAQLLMGYSSNSTLTENENKIQNKNKKSLVENYNKLVLSEGAGDKILKSLMSGADDAARAAFASADDAAKAAIKTQLDDVVRSAGGKIGKFSSADDILKHLKKGGVLDDVAKQELKMGLMKSPNTAKNVKNALAADMLKNADNIKTFDKVIAAGKGEAGISKLLQKKGIPADIADDIARKHVSKSANKVAAGSAAGSGAQSTVGKVSKTTKTAGKGGVGKGKNVKKPTKPRVKKTTYTPKGETNWQKFKKAMVGFSRTKTFKYLMIAGGLYLAYKWWTDEGSAPFPDCIGKNIPQEDFERMVNEGDGSVLISDTGVDAIDRAGGGKFYDDKKFVTGNGKYSGTWQDVPGTGVVISIEGQEYTMSCVGAGQDDNDNDNDNGGGDGTGGGGGNYQKCSQPPYAKGCQGGQISTIQGCIGVKADGQLGPKTEAALKSKGYSVPLSQESVDKILADCGQGGSSSTTTTTTMYTGGSQSGSIEGFV